MGSAADDIRAAIDAAGGAIPFSEFQRLALYGPAGFYTGAAGGRAGRRGGSFLTSPEVGPLFGAVVARYLDAQWEALGRPESFTVVDAGAGPGTLARSVHAARPACLAAMRYVAVELSAAQRALHPEAVESRPDLPDGPFDGVVIANELLDNLPVPALRVRRSVARGVRRRRRRRVRRGPVGAVRSAALGPAASTGARLAGAPPRRRRRLGGRRPVAAETGPAARRRLLAADDVVARRASVA